MQRLTEILNNVWYEYEKHSKKDYWDFYYILELTQEEQRKRIALYTARCIEHLKLYIKHCITKCKVYRNINA